MALASPTEGCTDVVHVCGSCVYAIQSLTTLTRNAQPDDPPAHWIAYSESTTLMSYSYVVPVEAVEDAFKDLSHGYWWLVIRMFIIGFKIHLWSERKRSWAKIWKMLELLRYSRSCGGILVHLKSFLQCFFTFEMERERFKFTHAHTPAMLPRSNLYRKMGEIAFVTVSF